MHAIAIDGETLVWKTTDTPQPGAHEVRIRVAATAINRADLMQRRGLYPPPPGASPIMGLECAGTIDQVGAEVTAWSPGDAVCALLAGGGYAEYAVVDQGSVLPIPPGLSPTEAAALPEVFATAWLNLFMEAGLASGERVLLHAGASGVGTAALQLCRAFGNPAFVTAGNPAKLQRCRELGAAGGHDRHNGSFLEAVRGFAPQGVDVILDPVGAAYLADNLQALAIGGRLVLIGLMGGRNCEIDLAQLMARRLRVTGSTLRARPHGEKATVMTQLGERVWPLLARGDIRPVIEADYPITRAAEAHDLVAANDTIGKVLLTMS